MQKLARPNDALASYKKAIELKPDYFQAYNNLGFLQQKLNKQDEAVLTFGKAQKLVKDNEKK